MRYQLAFYSPRIQFSVRMLRSLNFFGIRDQFFRRTRMQFQNGCHFFGVPLNFLPNEEEEVSPPHPIIPIPVELRCSPVSPFSKPSFFFLLFLSLFFWGIYKHPSFYQKVPATKRRSCLSFALEKMTASSKFFPPSVGYKFLLARSPYFLFIHSISTPPFPADYLPDYFPPPPSSAPPTPMNMRLLQT